MIREILKPMENGFKVMASESKWFFIQGFKRWEIRQMRKRLTEEYATLGCSYTQAQDRGTDFDPKASEHDLTLRQITFLRDEIKHLEDALAETRVQFLKKTPDTPDKEA